MNGVCIRRWCWGRRFLWHYIACVGSCWTTFRDNRPKKIISEEAGPELHHGRSLKSGVENNVVIHEYRRILSGVIVILLRHLPGGLMKTVTGLSEVSSFRSQIPKRETANTKHHCYPLEHSNRRSSMLCGRIVATACLVRRL